MLYEGSEALFRKEYGKYKQFYDAIVNRVEVYNQSLRRLEELEEAGEVFVLRPQIPLISKVERNKQKLEAFYKHGYDLMRKQYDAMHLSSAACSIYPIEGLCSDSSVPAFCLLTTKGRQDPAWLRPR